MQIVYIIGSQISQPFQDSFARDLQAVWTSFLRQQQAELLAKKFYENLKIYTF